MSNDFSSLMGMFYEPQHVFDRLQQRSRSWFPALLLTLGMAAMLWWYYHTVDFPWLIEHQLSARPDLSASQREAAAAMMQPRVLTWGSVLATLVVTPLLMAFHALVYFIATRFIGSDIRFGQWFGLAAWSAVPRLLCFPLMVLQILSSHGRVAVADLTMVSLNFLWLHLPLDHPWAGFADAIDLTVIWSVALATVGIRVWTGRPFGTALAFAMLPSLMIYGVWAGVLLLS